MHKIENLRELTTDMVDFDKVAGAFLGAASGDALGWPFEGHAKKRPDLRSWRGKFESWFKVSGGRFRPSLEYIATGEYSDDTQLILALSKSIAKVTYWWLDFALVELPFWTLYERGGGGATKRAATSWLNGVPPWHGTRPEQVKSYLSAGGNGAAMRILPHCVRPSLRQIDSFDEVAKSVITDAVITHGHPRALIGALAYSYILWYILRKSGTLQFGEMVDELISSANAWGAVKNLDSHWPDWRQTVIQHEPNYTELWAQTVEEMLSLLYIVKNALSEGALATDKSVLDKLGALSPKSNGAGTVTCAAAVYFASRYAAGPTEGLMYSASAIGADTDTLSSMTGGLLGALAGQQWLQPYVSGLQDAKHILSVAEKLRTSPGGSNDSEIQEVNKGKISDFLKKLNEDRLSAGDFLPNGKKVVRCVEVSELRGAQQNRRIWEILTDDEQTIFVRSISVKQKPAEETVTALGTKRGVLNVGISLAVADLGRSRQFYETLLGMVVVASSSKSIRFDNNLAVQRSDELCHGRYPITLFVQVADLDSTFNELKKQNLYDLGRIQLKGSARALEVVDPDGYMLELYERV